jgi:hypothetical protein
MKTFTLYPSILVKKILQIFMIQWKAMYITVQKYQVHSAINIYLIYLIYRFPYTRINKVRMDKNVGYP